MRTATPSFPGVLQLKTAAGCRLTSFLLTTKSLTAFLLAFPLPLIALVFSFLLLRPLHGSGSSLPAFSFPWSKQPACLLSQRNHAHQHDARCEQIRASSQQPKRAKPRPRKGPFSSPQTGVLRRLRGSPSRRPHQEERRQQHPASVGSRAHSLALAEWRLFYRRQVFFMN